MKIKHISVELLLVLPILGFPFEIGVMTDLHLINTFDHHSTDCMKHNIFSSWYYKSSTSTYYPFGHYGCRAPFPLYKSAIAKLKEILPHPQLILMGGDYVSYIDNVVGKQYLWVFSKYRIIRNTIIAISNEAIKLFDHTPIAFVIGNHDKLEQATVPVPWLPFKKYEYQMLYDLWIKNTPVNKQWVISMFL